MTGGHYAVIGAGASGAIQAIHLLRKGAGRVALIERERDPGRGAAYGTRRPEHLLNVTARRMVPDPADPAHFENWLAARGGRTGVYAQRRLFGDYLCELLAAAPPGLEIISGEAVAINRDSDRERIRLADGQTVAADKVVLALGNLRPATPRPFEPEMLAGIWIDDPWFGDHGSLVETENILLIGTGLTAIDAALTLDANGFRGRIVAISRRGLIPRAHLPRKTVAKPEEEFPTIATDLLKKVRKRADLIGWREAVHEVRSVCQPLWVAASQAERRRFLRHLRPWWDVHRHRIAPAVSERIERMQQEGRLHFHAGRIKAADRDGDAATISWRPRGADADRQLVVRRIINCSGPELEVERSADPLLSSLLADRRIRADPCRLGMDVDAHCRLIDSNGRPSESLYAIGPMTRGAFWESIAITEIAVQGQAIAERLCDPGRH